MDTTQISKDFRKTNQNLTFLDKDVLITGNNTLIGKEGLTFKILESLERNYNKSQHAIDRNDNEIMSSIANIENDIATRIETNHGDSKITTLTTANTVRESIHDATTLTQKNIINSNSELRKNISYLNHKIAANAVEERKVIYKESNVTNGQALSNFALINTDIMKKASIINVQSQLGFRNTDVQLHTNSFHDAIAHKDIQIMNNRSKCDELKFAAENAGTIRLDTTQQTEKLAHHIQENDLEALKRKEFLAQQILKKELDIIRSETIVVSKMKKGCCETKEKVDKRATYTQYKLKDQDINRIKDELTQQEIWDTDYIPYNFGPRTNTHNKDNKHSDQRSPCSPEQNDHNKYNEHNDHNKHNQHNENNEHNEHNDQHNEHNQHNQHNCNRG